MRHKRNLEDLLELARNLIKFPFPNENTAQSEYEGFISRQNDAVQIVQDAINEYCTEKWRDIESAPKDGAGVIVGYSKSNNWHYRIAYWDGEWIVACSGGEVVYPTHWLWLPQPPV